MPLILARDPQLERQARGRWAAHPVWGGDGTAPRLLRSLVLLCRRWRSLLALARLFYPRASSSAISEMGMARPVPRRGCGLPLLLMRGKSFHSCKLWLPQLTVLSATQLVPDPLASSQFCAPPSHTHPKSFPRRFEHITCLAGSPLYLSSPRWLS